ncbi:MAG: class I SAM-dependent methyltransferase, partial [Pseudonocardiaceae bacterium]
MTQTSVTIEHLEALLSPSGRALLDRLCGEDLVAADSMRLGTTLRTQFPPHLVAAALSQQELRRTAAVKFSRADRMFFTRSGLAQASAESISRYRAPRFADCTRLGDLCTGIGGDLISLADRRETLAVDID